MVLFILVNPLIFPHSSSFLVLSASSLSNWETQDPPWLARHTSLDARQPPSTFLKVLLTLLWQMVGHSTDPAISATPSVTAPYHVRDGGENKCSSVGAGQQQYWGCVLAQCLCETERWAQGLLGAQCYTCSWKHWPSISHRYQPV